MNDNSSDELKEFIRNSLFFAKTEKYIIRAEKTKEEKRLRNRRKRQRRKLKNK